MHIRTHGVKQAPERRRAGPARCRSTAEIYPQLSMSCGRLDVRTSVRTGQIRIRQPPVSGAPVRRRGAGDLTPPAAAGCFPEVSPRLKKAQRASYAVLDTRLQGGTHEARRERLLAGGVVAA